LKHESIRVKGGAVRFVSHDVLGLIIEYIDNISKDKETLPIYIDQGISKNNLNLVKIECNCDYHNLCIKLIVMDLEDHLSETSNKKTDHLNHLLTEKIGYGYAQEKFSRSLYLLLFSEGC